MHRSQQCAVGILHDVKGSKGRLGRESSHEKRGQSRLFLSFFVGTIMYAERTLVTLYFNEQ